MGFNQRSSQGIADVHHAKSSATLARLAFAGLVFLTLGSCKSSPPKSDRRSAPLSGMEMKMNLRKVDLLGQNKQGRFSSDGTKLIYVSRARPQHAHSQIYAYDLASKKEQRLTYQDGENEYPEWDRQSDGFFYASTTDEIKEDPAFLRQKLSQLKQREPDPGAQRPYEIYWSNLKGSKILRLTRSRDYDSQMDLHPQDSLLVFSSVRRGSQNLYSMDHEGENVKRLTQQMEGDSEPTFSPTGKNLLWVRNTGESESQIFTGDQHAGHSTALTSAPAQHRSPRWSRDGEWILFSSNRVSKDHFHLFVMKKDGSCLQQLTSSATKDSAPDFSPDGGTVIFTSDRTGEDQLFLMDFKAPSSCPEQSR